MNSPLVTVAMPAYNHGSFVGPAIESVLAQTFKDWELVIVDDCSSDNTLEVIRSYNDPRIRVFTHARNQGPSGASNTYLKEARGQWISPLPSDDLYDPRRLEQQVKYIEKHPDCGMVMTGVRFVDGQGNSLVKGTHFAAGLFNHTQRSRAEWLRFFFNEGNCICGSAVAYKKELIESVGNMDVRLLQLQDYDQWVRFALSGCEIGFIDEPLSVYRILPKDGNLSARSVKNHHQCVYERTHVLQKFLAIKNVRELRSIFPEITELALTSEQEMTWIQHQLALMAWKNGSRAHMHFALETWFSLLGDPKAAQQLTDWGMSVRHFNQMTAETPLVQNFLYDISYRIYSWLVSVLPPELHHQLKRTLKQLLKRSS